MSLSAYEREAVERRLIEIDAQLDNLPNALLSAADRAKLRLKLCTEWAQLARILATVEPRQ